MGPKSLAFRLFASAAAWTLVVIPAAAILLVSLYREAVERNFDARLNVYMTSLVASSTAESGGSPLEPANLGDPIFTIPFSGWYWQIKPLKGAVRPLYVSDSLLDQQLELPSKTGVSPDDTLTRRSYAPGPDGQNLRVVEREIRPGGDDSEAYSYAVAGDAAEIDADLAQFTTMVILALAVLGVGLVVATFFQVRFGLLPLRAIRQDLAAIRSGEAESLQGELPDEIKPLQTEEILTEQSVGVDDISGVDRKTTTTVAMDFGRITIRERLILYLFGTPGQDRFWFMWDDLVRGAIGAIVLVDTRRLADCFPAVDYFENSGLPFVIALNGFDGQQPYQPDEVREALQIGPDTPIITTDARHRADAKSALITLVEHALMARLR